MHVGEAFRITTNGEIIIQTRGYYSIIAQLHNKHGNKGKWIRTSILINNEYKARRYTSFPSFSDFSDSITFIKG